MSLKALRQPVPFCVVVNELDIFTVQALVNSLLIYLNRVNVQNQEQCKSNLGMQAQKFQYSSSILILTAVIHHSFSINTGSPPPLSLCFS